MNQWHRFLRLLPWIFGCLALSAFGKGGAFFATGEKPGNPAAKGWSLNWTYEQFIDGKAATPMAYNAGLNDLSGRGYTNVRNRRSWYFLDDQPFHVVVISGSEPDGSTIYLMAGGSFESRELALKDARELAWATWPPKAYKRRVEERYILLTPGASDALNNESSDLNGPSIDTGNGSGSGSEGTAPYIVTDLQDLYLDEDESGDFLVIAGGSSPLTYNWHFGLYEKTTTSGTYRVGYVRLGEDGTSAYVKISNAYGSVTSRLAKLHVRPTMQNTLSITSGLYVTEGGVGHHTAEFTVSLEWPSEYGVYFDYSTQDGTAKAYNDYVPASGQVFIPNGESSGIVSIDIIGNGHVQPDRTFYLNLHNAIRAVIVDGSIPVTIEDDDSGVKSHGKLDPSFIVGGDFALAPDNGLYTSGEFTSLGKVNIDGRNDPAFAPVLKDWMGNNSNIASFSSNTAGEVWVLSNNLHNINGVPETRPPGSTSQFYIVKLDSSGAKAPAWVSVGARVSEATRIRHFPDAGVISVGENLFDDTTGEWTPWIQLRGKAPAHEIISHPPPAHWVLPTGEILAGFTDVSLGFPFTSLLKFGKPIPIPGSNYSYLVEDFVAEGPLEDSLNNFKVLDIVDVDDAGRILTLIYYSNTQSRYGLHRVLSNGTRDFAFDFVEFEFPPGGIAMQPDGKILIGGSHEMYINGTAYRHMARINLDGTIDPSFKLKEGLTASDTVGKIVSAGNDMAYISTPLGTRRVFTSAALPPELTTPLIDQKQVLGTPLAFLAGATGMDPISYEWYLDGVKQADSGQTFQITPTDPAFVGEHTLQVRAVNPVSTAESRLATLTVLSPDAVPTITQQPVPHIAFQGEPPKFFVEARSPTPLRYQWYFDFKPLVGENGPALVGSIDTRDFTGNRSVYVDVTNDHWTLRSAYVYLQVEPFEDYETWRKEVFDPSLLTSYKSGPLWDLNHDGISNYQAFLMGLDPSETENLAKRATRVVVRYPTHDFVRFTYSLTASRLLPYFEQSRDLVDWELAWGDIIQYSDTGRSRSVLVQFPREAGESDLMYYRAVYSFTE